MLSAIYILCATTALLCAILLLRSYWKNGARLLLWSALCFVGLTIDNIVLYLDIVVFPDVPLVLVRKIAGLTGLALLIYGLIWDLK